LVSPATFANPGAITIDDFSPATPYPSTIDVSCVPSPLTSINVTITNLSLTYASDVDILLVSPTGEAIMLMSDAGDASSIDNAILGFDDAEPNSLPESAPVVTGVYKPTNYGASDNMPPPAPQGPYVTTLATFNGSIPNGIWSLYVVDDAQIDTGNISGGWSLTLGWGAAPPPPPRFISLSILSDGSFQATLQGQPGKTYVIQASVDLTSWTPVSTNTLSGQTGNFVDPHNPSLTRRFYRAVAQP